MFDEFPADARAQARRRDRRRALSQLRRAGADLHLVSQRPHDLRLHLQGRAVYPRRPAAAPADGGRRPQPPAQRVPPDEPARLRGGARGVGLCAVPALDLRGRAHPPARGAQPPRRPRAPGAPAPLDRRAPRTRSGPRSTFTTRCFPTSRGSICRSGQQARPAGTDPVPGINRRGGWHLPGLTDHNHLRHLLQVGFADHELGLIMRRMRRTKIFDDALLIVLADHGYSFDLGVSSRRLVTDGTVERGCAGALLRQAARADRGPGGRQPRAQHRRRRPPSPTCSAPRSTGATTAIRPSPTRRATVRR